MMGDKNDPEEFGWIKKGICGLMPTYGEDGGNYSRLFFRNNPPIMVEKRVNAIIAKLARYFQKNIKLIRKQASEITGQRSMNPLPINSYFIFVPFKTRKPIGKDDGAVGYFLYNMIDETQADDRGTRLLLKNGQVFKINDSNSTAKRHIAYAHQIFYYLQKRDKAFNNSYEICSEYNSDYNQLATKGDLVVLSRELVYRIDKLK